ncbi:hypothetical protein UFOVP507_29 [uncultured Caudovirales phage]|uniref:Uncharacterized protein n=1 Tax=uncultured Caudovirales phage TaxID=2100421 RepID=A0A6J5MQX1_9CAUD|nr:hypothetical protein UFOVP507_29 [uncultured Caudovirales phage]
MSEINTEVVVVEEKVQQRVQRRKKLGRPRKEDLKKAKLPIGRPKNDHGRLIEFKQRLLGTSGAKVIEKIIEIGQTDGHPGQVAALKMAIDRILPMSMFEKDSKGQRNAVTINITGIGEIATVPTVETDIDITDVEFSEEENET